MAFVGWRVDITQNIEANACTDNHSLNLCGGKIGATKKKVRNLMHIEGRKITNSLRVSYKNL